MVCSNARWNLDVRWQQNCASLFVSDACPLLQGMKREFREREVVLNDV